MDQAAVLPERTSNFIDRITFGWVTPLLSLGYARPLEATDLYKLEDDRKAAYIGEIISASFERRMKVAEEYNTKLANGQISPGWKSMWWTLKGNRAKREKEWREKDGKKHASLVWAMNDSVKWWFWSAGILKVIGDTAQVTSPLLVIFFLFSLVFLLTFLPGQSDHHLRSGLV